MCLGAIPLAVKAFGGSNKTAALSMISPALAIGTALTKKKKSTAVSPNPTNAAGAPTFGPSPSYGGG